jgi:hypothetical protein
MTTRFSRRTGDAGHARSSKLVAVFSMRVAKILFLPLMMALVVDAFAGVSMKLAPDLAATTHLPVSGRNQGNQLAYGPWHVAMPASYQTDAWQFSGTPRFVPANAELTVKAERAWLEFEVVADTPESRPSSAACLAQGRFASLTKFHARSEDETTITIPGFPRLDCDFRGARTGTLTLRADFATQIDHGEVTFGADQWILRSVNTHSKQRSNFPLARFGYEILLGGRVVAAVETYGAGRVWLLPELSRDQQDQVSTVVAALLYYGTLLEQQDA